MTTANDTQPRNPSHFSHVGLHPYPSQAARSREHPHHSRGGVRVSEARDAVQHRKGLGRLGAAGAQGVLSGQAAVSADAHRHDLEISGDDRVSRELCPQELGLELLVYTNEEGLKHGIKPWEDSERHTELMKTDALKAALNKYEFDAAFGGARRDEEKSRAKERVFSFRDKSHRWDPKNQRPELWNLYNGRVNKGESIRVFPMSNWTELDVWQYIHLENIPIVPLYLSAPRKVVRRNGILLMRDDDRMPLLPGEEEETKMVRFRTLGCYPLSGAVESEATTLPEVIQEMLLAKTSERQGRIIDQDEGGAGMEEKKRRGYF